VLVSVGALPHGRIHWHTVVLRLARVHSRGRGSSKRRINGVEVALCVVSARSRCSRRVTCRRSWSVTLGHRTVGESSRGWRGGGRYWGSRRVRRRGRVGGRLNLSRTRLLLEDGVVAKTLAFALLAVSTYGVGLVAL
jgi:hypothetical protein